MLDDQKDYVLQSCRDHDVKFIRLWFTDILGQLKSFAITVEELEEALDEGQGFDGASIEGFARIDESDMIAMPDPATFAILPWRPRERGVARMFCDIQHPDGTPFEGDPRFVLKRQLKRASDLGYTFYVGPELEYFYFKSAEGPPEGLDKGGYFDLPGERRLRDLHAEAARRRERLRHAHVSVAVQGRPERLLRCS